MRDEWRALPTFDQLEHSHLSQQSRAPASTGTAFTGGAPQRPDADCSTSDPGLEYTFLMRSMKLGKEKYGSAERKASENEIHLDKLARAG